MQRTALRNMPLAVLLLFPLALAGCASEGSVGRADTDATAAMNTANQSKSEADQALSTAQQALKTAPT